MAFPIDDATRRRPTQKAYALLRRDAGPARTNTPQNVEGPAPIDHRPRHLRVAAYAERHPSADATGNAIPTRAGPGGGRIGVGAVRTSGGPSVAATGDAPGSARTRSTGIGTTRERGIQSLPEDQRTGTTAAITQRLLVRAMAATGSGAQIRFQIGNETLTAGELELALRRDPARFQDFLESHGIAVTEFNELLDDVLAGGVQAGQTFDLREGSALATAYRIGGANGAVVDNHLDPSVLTARADGNASAVARTDISNEDVRGPGFWQQVSDAIEEALGWIARLFGSSWNPDTITYDGRVDEEHFEGLGRSHASGDRSYELQLLLQTPNGERRLRQSLLAQKPATATDLQWERAVNAYMRGLQSGATSADSAHRAPQMSPSEAETAMVYLRANNYSSAARADIDTVLAQREPIRGQSLSLLVSLPDAERENMLSLLRPPPAQRPANMSDADESRYFRQRDFHGPSTTDAQRVAMFELMRRDGFHADLSSQQVLEGFQAVDQAAHVPEAFRTRFLDATVRLGLSRAHLVTDIDRGLGALLRSQPERAEQIMSSVEAALGGSTRSLEQILAASAFTLRPTNPTAGRITSSGQRARTVSAFERNNITLGRSHGGRDFTISARGGSGPNDVSLQRYFNDSAYRRQVLTDVGMDRTSFERFLTNVTGSLNDGTDASNTDFNQRTIRDLRAEIDNPATTPDRRAQAQQELLQTEMMLAAQRAPTNVEIDISAGSRADHLFGLDGTGPSVTQRLARDRIASSPRDDVAIRVPTTSGTPTTIGFAELSRLLRENPDPAAAQTAFETAHPGVDFDETVLLFANIENRVYTGALQTPNDGTPLTIDMTTRQSDRGLEALRRRYTDSRHGNITTGRLEPTTLGSRSTIDRADPTNLRSNARIGGGVGNNWFQFGVFHRPGGYSSSMHLESRARARFDGTPNPAHALGAVLDLDSFNRAERVPAGMRQQSGMAAGRTPDTFLVDPSTGARAEGRDVQLLSFVGRGSRDRAAFTNTVDRVRRTFDRYGGVPTANMERYTRATPDEMFQAVAGEIQHDPRPADQRTDANGDTRPRTIVVHFAGHTASDPNNHDVAGMALRGGELSPERVAELNRMAQDQGVNLVWVVDACRAGEYVHQGREARIEELRAAGTLPTQVEHLDGLRTSLIDRHQAMVEIRNMHIPPANRRSPCQAGACPLPGYGPVSVPASDRVAQMGAAALAGGTGSQAMRDLQTLVDQIQNDVTLTPTQKAAFSRYLDGIRSTITHREALRGSAGVDQSILTDGMVAGTTRWQTGRYFMTHELGRTTDKINADIRRNLPE